MSDTRQEIIQVAMRHFAEHDYASVNLERIAGEAHVTRAPIYYYFKNKEGLYRAVVDSSLEDARARLDALLGADRPIFDILRDEYLYCINSLGLYSKIWFAEPQIEDCQMRIHAFQQWLVDRKRQILLAARERGELREDCDVSEIVTLIYIFYYGVLQTRQTAAQLTGFSRTLLEESEEWFIHMLRTRYGP